VRSEEIERVREQLRMQQAQAARLPSAGRLPTNVAIDYSSSSP
jgi:hypothetical protein